MNIDVKFHGIDYWSRPVFKVVDKEVYIGSTDTLFPNKVIAPNNTPEEITNYFKDHVDELTIFGSTFDEDDPLGTKLKSDIVLNFVM